MMTIEEIGLMLDMLEANYGSNFYAGTNKKNVLKTWAVQFANDDPKEVAEAVKTVINTCVFRPNIANIREAMANAAMKGQMTEVEAFRAIDEAVGEAYDKYRAYDAFEQLPPILRKLVGSPNRLREWRKVSNDAWQSVVMSAIRSSYRQLAAQEREYYSLPKDLRESQKWRIEAPEIGDFPVLAAPKSMDDMMNDIYAETKRDPEVVAKIAEKYKERLAAFLDKSTVKKEENDGKQVLQ